MFDLMVSNPNILDQAKNDYASKFNHQQRVDYFESILNQLEDDEKRSLVNTGVTISASAVSS